MIRSAGSKDLVQVGNRLIPRDEQHMRTAQFAATFATCLSARVGAAIVKNGNVLATGCNTPLVGGSCVEKGFCYAGLERCGGGSELPSSAIHAEVNAIWQATKQGFSVKGASIYVTHKPCSACLKFMVLAQIKEVVINGG